MGDQQHHEPSLELPSLFGRKKKAAPAPEPAPAPAPAPAEPEAVEPETVEATVVVPEPSTPAPASAPAAKDASKAADWDEAREFKLPELPGRTAAVITGLLVGAVGALLTWGSLQACEGFKGTDSCGREGFFLLLFILFLMILAGGLLLAAWEVADPKSTSALAVGIICVIVLLLLIEELFSWWMFLAIPIVSAGAYAAAHWVTTALVDESDLEPEPEQHDIR